MQRRTLLITLAALPLLPRAAFGAEARTIPLDLSQGQPRVRLSIGGIDRGDAIFDTGASGSVLHRPLAEELGLPNEGPAAVRSGAGGETIETFRTTVRDATLGGVAAPPFVAVALPMLRPNTIAVLSPNIFTGDLVRLDFSGEQLEVLAKTEATIPQGEPIPYDSGPRPLPSIPLVLPGGITLLAHLDTGAPGAITLPREMADTLPLSTPLEPAGTARLINGERAIFRATLRGAARVGPLTMIHPELLFMEGLPHGNIGMTLLRRLDIILDPAERRLWASARSTT